MRDAPEPALRAAGLFALRAVERFVGTAVAWKLSAARVTSIAVGYNVVVSGTGLVRRQPRTPVRRGRLSMGARQF
jgi:hypothetical protein